MQQISVVPARVRVSNALGGVELLPWTTCAPEEVFNMLTTLLYPRPSLDITFFQDGRTFNYNTLVPPGADLELTAVLKEALAADCRQEMIARIASFPTMEPIVRDDPAIALAAVSHSGGFLQFASEDCQDDMLIVKAAVANDGTALRYASEAMQDNTDIVWTAVLQCGDSLQYASSRCKDNRALALGAVRHCTAGTVFKHVSERLRNDKQVAMEALQHATPNLASTIFFHASTSLRANKDVAMQAVLRSGDALMFVSDALKSDRQVLAAAAAREDRQALENAQLGFKDDMDIAMAAVTTDTAPWNRNHPCLCGNSKDSNTNYSKRHRLSE